MFKFVINSSAVMLLMSLGLISQSVQAQETHGVDKNPGFQIRLVEEVTELIRDDLLQYATAYLNWDLNWPQTAVKKITAFPFYFDLYIDALEHDLIRTDLQKFKFDFLEDFEGRNKSVVLFEVPLLENWNISSTYHYKEWGIPWGGDIVINLHNMSSIIAVHLESNEEGILNPTIEYLNVQFGQSNVYHNNWFKQFWIQQFVNIARITSENAINMMGRKFINSGLENKMAAAFHDMTYEFNYDVPPLGKNSTFVFDYKLTHDALIRDGKMDLFFLGDIAPSGQQCGLPQVPQRYQFYDSNEHLQFILSDRVINCFLWSLEQDHYFQVTLSTENFIKDFGTHYKQVTAQWIQGLLPIISEKYGDDQQLEIELTMVSPRVSFGTSDGNNIEITAEIDIAIKKAGEYNNIFYDNMNFKAAMDTEVDMEVWFANVKQMEFTFGNGSYIRKLPLYNDMDMTETQYSDFKAAVYTKTQRWQAYFNDVVFVSGIPLPYWTLELDTWFQFYDGVLHVVADLFYHS